MRTSQRSKQLGYGVALIAMIAGCSGDSGGEGTTGEDSGATLPDGGDDTARADTTVKDTGGIDTSTPSDTAKADSVGVDSATDTTDSAPVIPTRVIFFLGDGMGIGVQTAARIYSVGEDGSLAMDELPETGFVRTYSKDAQVTDSAAAMTAYMCGVKGNNDVLAMSPDTAYKGATGTPVTTFLELAEKAGWATGVVTTTRVTHATPAATYAHISDRDLENDIAAQVVPGGAKYNAALADGLEVIFGGGQKQFLPTTVTGGGRTDARNLVDEMKAKGYAYANDTTSFAAITGGTNKALALFTNGHMSYDLDRDPAKEPSLAEMSTKAIDVLARNPKGYFLMIEGGRIDHALHDTNAKRALQDTVAFDRALKAVLDKVKLTDPTLAHTLIVVTADHDHTMVLNGYAKRTGPTTSTSAGVLGLVKNFVTGANDLDVSGMPYSIIGFGNGDNRVNGPRSSATALTDTVTGGNDYHQEAAIKMAPGAETHGGTDVFIGAVGLQADRIHGFMTNTEVFDVLRLAAGF